MISSNVINLLFATSAWLTSPNAAELCLLPDSTEQVSYAETFVSKSDGHWTSYAGSDDCYRWGVRAASVYRVDSRWVLDGKVEYSNFTGRHMSGSAWINPEERPFDIVEPTTENAGTKNLEIYRLASGVGAEFGRLAVGTRVDLISANYAKQKDLRHQNKLMDLTATTGILWRIDYRWSLGADFFYRRTIEELTFSTAGTTDRRYLSFIDYGAAFGVTEYSSSYGITDENAARPWVEDRYGLDLQLNTQGQTGLNWYNDLHFDAGSGYFGRWSLFTPVYMEHTGISWSYRSCLGIGRHQVDFEVDGSHIVNRQNLFQYTTNASGLNEYSYYGDLETSRRNNICLMLSYRYSWNSWLFNATFGHNNRDLTASYYPFYRTQDLHYSTIDLAVKRHWRLAAHDWSLTLVSGFSKGDGNRADDCTYDGLSNSSNSSGNESTSGRIVSTNLYTSADLLKQQTDYLVSPQANCGFSAEYGHQLKKAPIRLYLILNAQWQKAFDTTYQWDDTRRQQLGLKIGCSF